MPKCVLRVVCVASERAFQDRAGPARERAEDGKREREERKQIRGDDARV